GTTAAGTVSLVNSVLTASGSHAYATAGTFSIALTVTNASGLSATAGTTATIADVSTGANLKGTTGQNVQSAATKANAAYDFDVNFVSGGVQLIGAHGTTFNGADTLFVAGAKSISGQLAGGDDHVRITGTGKNVILSLGGGQNDFTCRGFK